MVVYARYTGKAGSGSGRVHVERNVERDGKKVPRFSYIVREDGSI
jgi:hypothetical protein